MILEKLKPQRHGIFPRGFRHLVEEGLDGIGRVGGPHRAPPQHRNPGLHGGEAHGEVGDGIGNVGRALDGCEVDPVLHRHAFEQRARHDRLPDDVVRPRDDVAVSIEAGLHRVHIGRAVAAALHVVVARPLHLDGPRPADGLRHLDRFRHHIGIEHRAPAKTAARAHDMKLDLVGSDAGNLRGDILVEVRHLMSAPDLDDAILHLRHGIERFERRMREVGEGERGFQRLRCTCKRLDRVAIVAGDSKRRCLGLRLIGRENLRRRTRLGLLLVPRHGDEIASLDRRPHGLGDDGHTARNLHDVDHALHGLGLRRIEGGNGGAEFRRMDHHGGRHVRQLHVDGEFRRAVGLHLRVVALEAGVADLRPRAGGLQRNVRGRINAGGFRRHLAIGGGLSRGMRQRSTLRDDRGCRDAPFFRGCLDQHHAHRSTCGAVAFP